MPLDVLVVHHDPVMLTGIRDALERAGDRVVAAETDLGRAVLAAGRDRPDVCLLGCPASAEGHRLTLGAVHDVQRTSPSTTVVLLGACPGVPELVAALAAGAVGYLPEDVRLDRLSSVLAAAHAGEPVVPRHLVAEVVAALLRVAAASVPAQRVDGLTHREAEVLSLLRAGHSTAAIAHRLSVTPVTVRTHIGALVRKLQARDRGDLVRSWTPAR